MRYHIEIAVNTFDQPCPVEELDQAGREELLRQLLAGGGVSLNDPELVTVLAVREVEQAAD